MHLILCVQSTTTRDRPSLCDPDLATVQIGEGIPRLGCFSTPVAPSVSLFRSFGFHSFITSLNPALCLFSYTCISFVSIYLCVWNPFPKISQLSLPFITFHWELNSDSEVTWIRKKDKRIQRYSCLYYFLKNNIGSTSYFFRSTLPLMNEWMQ